MKELRLDAHHVLCCTGSVRYGNGTENSDSRRAFVRGDLLYFAVRVPRQIGAVCASVRIRSDSTKSIKEVPLKWLRLDDKCEIWQGELPPNSLDSGLYFLRAEMDTAVGTAMTVRTQGEECTFRFADEEIWSYQLTVCDFSYPAPEWIFGGTVYQVFVDRFRRGADTPVKKDAIWNADWENGMPQYPAYPGAPLANNMFFGGNLNGVTEKLDYIASLGVNCIYLSPVFEAYSNHKYDTGDYFKIDEMFGGEEAFDELIAEAEKRNIRIVLDGVFNHTGDDSVYFNRYGHYPSLGAYQSKDSPYYPWYSFQKYPDEYTCWWNIKILPRIHTEVPACREFFLGESGVIAHYAKRGIGGFRLDVADELPDVFLDGVKARLAEADPENILWGEVWEDASNKVAYGKRRRYFQGKQLDGVMNYELRTGLIRYLRLGDVSALRYAICEVMPNAPKRVQDAQMNLFGTHDTVRILTALAGKDAEGRTNDELAVARMTAEERELGLKRLRIAYLILATLPGVPLIYYGDEVGMEGYADPFNRMPFPWQRMDEDLLGFYRAVGRVRTSHEVYREGVFKLLRLDQSFFIFERVSGKEICMTAVNVGTETYALSFPATPEATALLGETCEDGSVLLPALSGAIISLPANAAGSLAHLKAVQ